MRKIRSDKGTRKPHPTYCAHCKMVQEYRDARAEAIERLGGWRNEDAPSHPSVPRFKQWLQTYYHERRAAAVEPIGIVRVLERMNDVDAYPTDDYIRTLGEISTLNRIDQEWECDAIVNVAFDHPEMLEVPEYCGLPEHDPFTNRCWDHTPGNLSSWHM